MASPVKMAVLVSGGGTTMQYILDQIKAGVLDATIETVVSSRSDAYALERAKNNGIPHHAVNRGDFSELAGFNREILGVLGKYDVGLVVLAGFMSLLTPEFVRRYPNRIVNVHPALIPSFCGEKLYGDHVHQAVLDAGAKLTGCTIHFVDEIYDHGPIILQRAVPVLDGDTLETLRARVQAEEKKLYVEALRLFAEGRLEVRGRRVFVRDN
ncbi:MAG: phosphoribosylglycinamide formyltransferase [bacterium]